MSRTAITVKGSAIEPSLAALTSHLTQAGSEGFWLDIEAPDDSDFEVLEQGFRFHPLTIEDVKHRNQRPKLEEYPGYAFMVLFESGWEPNTYMQFEEHHLYLGPRWLVTVHDRPAPSLDRLRERVRSAPELTKGDPSFLSYMVVDALVDSNFPILERMDEVIDGLQDRILERAEPRLLSEVYELKHDVTTLRRLLGAQRDLFQRMITHSLDGRGGDMAVYWRDVYDHIIRQYETVDSLRDLLAGATDVYLSTVSNRLSVTTKTLTVIASLFLPLTWLTGFFGMNFAYLTQTLETPRWAFWVAVVTMLGLLGIQVYLFRRRGWF